MNNSDKNTIKNDTNNITKIITTYPNVNANKVVSICNDIRKSVEKDNINKPYVMKAMENLKSIISNANMNKSDLHSAQTLWAEMYFIVKNA